MYRSGTSIHVRRLIFCSCGPNQSLLIHLLTPPISGNDVIRFLAGLHLVENPPSVLAVDACLIPTGPLPGQLVNWERTLARIAATLADCAVRNDG